MTLRKPIRVVCCSTILKWRMLKQPVTQSKSETQYQEVFTASYHKPLKRSWVPNPQKRKKKKCARKVSVNWGSDSSLANEAVLEADCSLLTKLRQQHMLNEKQVTLLRCKMRLKNNNC